MSRRILSSILTLIYEQNYCGTSLISSFYLLEKNKKGHVRINEIFNGKEQNGKKRKKKKENHLISIEGKMWMEW